SYVALFGSRFQEVYGPLGSVAALLVWAYITAAIFLFGAEFSAARGRDRAGPVWVEHTPVVKKTDKLLR
ncbi:MAG: YihY/virulence factor BrkB family protein, partial [Chloroflexota bacterium]|nr:YihY/virulence factor BrkB family protein [Chloroflexota bacterium]